jgi:hypothetical protein
MFVEQINYWYGWFVEQVNCWHGWFFNISRTYFGICGTCFLDVCLCEQNTPCIISQCTLQFGSCVRVLIIRIALSFGSSRSYSGSLLPSSDWLASTRCITKNTTLHYRNCICETSTCLFIDRQLLWRVRLPWSEKTLDHWCTRCLHTVRWLTPLTPVLAVHKSKPLVQ